MSNNIEIRVADTNDVSSLAAVGHESFRAAYEDWSKPDDLIEHLDAFFSEEAIRKEIQLPGHYYLIASNKGEPAGFVKIRENKRPKEVPATRALELHQVYVMPDQQRFGIGGRLIEAAARFASDKSADGIWLSVWEDALWAVNCYRKYGFEEVGVTDFKLGQAIYTDLLMWRAVDPTA